MFEQKVDVILGDADLVVILNVVELLDGHFSTRLLHLEGRFERRIRHHFFLDGDPLGVESFDFSFDNLVHFLVLKCL